jgi:P4 family phage/plasmid primase-like protien
VWNVELLKKLTGGEPIKARKMGQDEFTFQPQFKLFMSGNEPPSLHDIDEAIKARLVLIPFDVTIPAEERDPLLFEKLKEEAPAIMAWVLEGYKAWKVNGLGTAPACEQATQGYLEEEAGLSHTGFIDDCLQPDPLSGVLSYKELYTAYTKWAGEQGDPAMSKRRLCKLLKRNGLKSGSSGGGKNNQKGVIGYRLTNASFSPF